MDTWTPSEQYRKVAEANREYYARTAQMYDTSETCVTNRHLQRQLEDDLDQIIKLTGQSPQTIRALDACGGTGNIALKLLRRGLNVTISDISSTQLALFKQKCLTENFSAQVHCGEIGELLSQNQAQYDLIIFSSALHHLENITDVLGLAFDSLRPGGLLFTVFDPTATQNHKRTTKTILWADYVLFKLLDQTSDLPSAIGRYLHRKVSGQNYQTPQGKQAIQLSDDTLGVLAEYHVGQGINDLALVEELKRMGYQIVWHMRYPGGRYAVTRWAVGLLRDATQFKLLLKKT